MSGKSEKAEFFTLAAHSSQMVREWEGGLGDGQDGVYFDAAGSGNRHGIACLASQQSFTHRGFVGDQAGGWPGLIRADLGVFVLAAIISCSRRIR